MDNELPLIETKDNNVESTTINEESDNRNQCIDRSFGVGTEWIGSIGEIGDNARRIEWRKW